MENFILFMTHATLNRPSFIGKDEDTIYIHFPTGNVQNDQKFTEHRV